MSIVLDAESVAPVDRAEVIRSLIWDAVVRVEIEHRRDASQIQARGRITELGPLTVCSIRSNAGTVERTARLTRDPVDAYLFVGLQVTGTSMVIQSGREAVLHPGDLAVYDTRVPYTLINSGGIHQHYFRIPIDDLALSGRLLGAVTAVRLDGTRPLARVTASHLGQLADQADRIAPADAERVAAPTIGLIRALLTSQVPSQASGEALYHSLEPRIRAYVRAHLKDRELCAAGIAAAHHISVRQLYRVLARADVSLAEWVRDQRLAGCRAALADPGCTLTIAALAHEWGFADATHFGRAFKAAYGRTPREWRQLR